MLYLQTQLKPNKPLNDDEKKKLNVKGLWNHGKRKIYMPDIWDSNHKTVIGAGNHYERWLELLAD